jgi:hypothetical protein
VDAEPSVAAAIGGESTDFAANNSGLKKRQIEGMRRSLPAFPSRGCNGAACERFEAEHLPSAAREFHGCVICPMGTLR